MKYTQIINDAQSSWAVIVDYQPNLIGHEYTFKPIKGMVIKDAYDEEDLYFMTDLKSPIPKGTELSIDTWWKNFYGSYFRVKYEGKVYNVRASYIELQMD